MVSDSSKDIQTPSPPPNSLPPSLGTNFQVIYNNTLMRNTPPLPVSTPNRPSPTLPHNPPTSASYYQDDQILTQKGLYAIKTPNHPPHHYHAKTPQLLSPYCLKLRLDAGK